VNVITVTGKKCGSGVHIASADMVKVHDPFAYREPTHERGDGKGVSSRIRVCDGEMDEYIIMEDVFGKGSTRMPL